MGIRTMRLAVGFAGVFLLQGCSEPTKEPVAAKETVPVPALSKPASMPTANPTKNAYYGDTHVHTKYSFDAFIFGTTASPDDAYDFAKGGMIKHPAGFEMQLDEPLDFYAVSDHGFYLGTLPAMATPGTKLNQHELSRPLESLGSDGQARRQNFNRIIQFMQSDRGLELLDKDVFKETWDDIIAAANRHNDPGKFTTFIAYEYTASGDAFQNLHRNVIFKGDTAPELPLTRLDSLNPEDLWAWMDQQRAAGHEALAIPHNGNGSNGEMFKLIDFTGNPLDANYAALRMRNEPLVEISQVKGTSDTHPALSPNDEWADFEIMPFRIASPLLSDINGSYIRQAWMNGIEMQAKQGFNPYKFGVIGASDTHNATYAGDESDYWSKTGLTDGDPVSRGSVPMTEPDEDGNKFRQVAYSTWSAAGLAGVWAEENSRDSIYAAMRRKETFGTSGPRTKVRFFAGYDMPGLDDKQMLEKAYANGVPMGGDLIAKVDRAPEFLVWAMRDTRSAGLQRLQVIKASVKNGKAVEKVFDIACSDGLTVNPNTHRCPDNGAKVNLADCSISADLGAGELKAKWQDPEFDSSEQAFYYARVLENPVCRWSTWDAIRAGTERNPDLHATIQERAWSSPIWVAPTGRKQK